MSERSTGGDEAAVRRAASHAESLNSLGRHHEALVAAGRGLAAAPDDEELVVQAAVAHLGVQQPGEALQLLQRAAAANPHSSRVHRVLSFAALRADRVGEALSAARRAVELSPFDPHAHGQLARAAAAARDRTAAVAAAERAIQLAPDLADPHIAMADALYPAGVKPGKDDLRRAETHLVRALQIEPDNASALNDLARVHLGLGHQVRAAGHLASAVQADPQAAVVQHNMDVVFVNLIARAHWLLFVMWFLSRNLDSDATGMSVPWVPIALAVAGFGLVGWVAYRLRQQIPRHLAAFVRGFARRQRLGAAWALCLLATAVLFLAAAVAPSAPLRSSLLSLAWLPLLAGAVLSWVRYFRDRRARPR